MLKHNLLIGVCQNISVISFYKQILQRYKKYIEFTQELSHKTLIFISHGKGKNPIGRLAESVKFDADSKVFVKGFRAFITSRYGGGEPIDVWEQGAKEYWGEFN